MPKLNIDLSKVVRYLKAYAGKKSIVEMCHDLDLSATFIRELAKSQGIEISIRKRQTLDKAEQIKELLDKGLNPSQIARKLGMYYNSVYYISETYLGKTPSKREWKNRTESQNDSVFFNPSERENWLI
jgi:AraC-like DNA-binding protein